MKKQIFNFSYSYDKDINTGQGWHLLSTKLPNGREQTFEWTDSAHKTDNTTWYIQMVKHMERNTPLTSKEIDKFFDNFSFEKEKPIKPIKNEPNN